MSVEYEAKKIIDSGFAVGTSDKAVAHRVSVLTGIDVYVAPPQEFQSTGPSLLSGYLDSAGRGILNLCDIFSEKGPPKPGVVVKPKTWQSVVTLVGVILAVCALVIIAKKIS